MPRRPRLALAGVATHIIQRGNNRGACFFADEDYALYLHHLEDLARMFGCAVHAWALMTNHVHLLVTPQETDSASLLMKHLGPRYVQYVNRAYRRSGTLWELNPQFDAASALLPNRNGHAMTRSNVNKRLALAVQPLPGPTRTSQRSVSRHTRSATPPRCTCCNLVRPPV